MQIERIRFEEVFDVQASRGDFSFRSGGRTQYGVSFRRGSIPSDGATYAVAFARPGDWASVLGWRDLASTQVSLNSPASDLLLARSSDLILYGPFFFAGGFLLGGIPTALGFAGLFLAATCYLGFRDIREGRRVKQALLAVSTVQ